MNKEFRIQIKLLIIAIVVVVSWLVYLIAVV